MIRASVATYKGSDESKEVSEAMLMILDMLLNKDAIVRRSRKIGIMRNLFSTINNLLQMNTDRLYPSCNDDSALVNSFADFLAEKILKICTSIMGAK